MGHLLHIVECLWYIGIMMIALGVFGFLFNLAYKRFPRFREKIDAFTANSADWED